MSTSFNIDDKLGNGEQVTASLKNSQALGSRRTYSR